MRITRWCFPLACVLLACAMRSACGQSVDGGGAVQADWPREVVITVGDIRTRIDGPKLWTLSGIDYRDAVMAVEGSAYGTVLTIRGVGHLGTAHFLDVPGKPGEVEKEIVTSLKLFIDGSAVDPFSPTMSLQGDSFRMERASMIRGVALRSTVAIERGSVIETAHLRATEPIDLQKAHPMMYAWTPQATVYAWGDAAGIQKRGTFQTDGKTQATQETEAEWLAVFNPISGKGSVCYLLEHPADTQGWFLLIDAPDVYRKAALYSFVDTVVPAGYEGTFRSAVGFFDATEETWEAQALQKATELRMMGAELAY